MILQAIGNPADLRTLHFKKAYYDFDKYYKAL
jgi:hypothetical protein